MKAQQFASFKKSLVHPAKMTVAATLALLAAKVVGLPEIYWAPIAALIVVQSDYHAMMVTSWLLLVGTALGACAGALLASYVGPGVVVFALGVFGLGLLAAVLRLDRRANHFAAIALLLVLLIGPANEAWDRALDRFAEFSTGIIVGLLISALWPEQQTSHVESVIKSAQPKKSTNTHRKHDSPEQQKSN
jgi:uncharacterized membrane protein YgaE (UPF0421/DUF939 family)